MGRFITVAVGLLIANAIFWGVAPAGAAAYPDFSAEVYLISPGKAPVRQGLIKVGRMGVRTETARGGEGMALIFRPDLHRVWQVLPEQKLYREYVSEELGRPPLPSSPRSPCSANPEYQCKKEGWNTVSERRARRWEIVVRPKGKAASKPSYLWVDPALGVVIREQYPDGTVTELRRIRVGNLPASAFQVPAGFRKVDPAKAQGADSKK